MKRTLITHFYNEQVLLPFWIKHHLPYFDDALLIDYASTDNSVEIIRNLAPNWKVVKSRNPLFDAVECDREVMDYENGIEGWKLALTVTEFMTAKDLDSILNFAEQENYLSIQCIGTYLVDPPRAIGRTISNDIPLVRQCQYGVYEYDLPDGNYPAKHVDRPDRWMHRNQNGQYTTGRHKMTVTPCYMGWGNVYISKTLFAPFSIIMPRKTQFAHKIPEGDVIKRLGWHHRLSAEEIDKIYANTFLQCTNLFTDKDYVGYRDAINTLPMMYV